MNIEFSGEIWYWRTCSPFYFVTIPEEQSLSIKEISSLVTYGWGMIPVKAHIGKTEFETTLFPKDGKYALPLRAKMEECLKSTCTMKTKSKNYSTHSKMSLRHWMF